MMMERGEHGARGERGRGNVLNCLFSFLEFMEESVCTYVYGWTCSHLCLSLSPSEIRKSIEMKTILKKKNAAICPRFDREREIQKHDFRESLCSSFLI